MENAGFMRENGRWFGGYIENIVSGYLVHGWFPIKTWDLTMYIFPTLRPDPRKKNETDPKIPPNRGSI